MLCSALSSMSLWTTSSLLNSLSCFNGVRNLKLCSIGPQFFNYVSYYERWSDDLYQIRKSCIVSWLYNLVTVMIIESLALIFVLSMLNRKNNHKYIFTATTTEMQRTNLVEMSEVRLMHYRCSLDAAMFFQPQFRIVFNCIRTAKLAVQNAG